MKLKNIVGINVGQNVSRIKDKEDKVSRIYTNEDLLNDLHEKHIGLVRKTKIGIARNEKYFIYAGDILYSFISSTAGIVSQENDGKIINQNFARLTLNTKEIDPRYLCYVLNESISVDKQMSILMQGSVVPKMTPAILSEINIEFPELSKQLEIGNSYFDLNRYYYLSKMEIELQKKTHFEILKKLDQ